MDNERTGRSGGGRRGRPVLPGATPHPRTAPARSARSARGGTVGQSGSGQSGSVVTVPEGRRLGPSTLWDDSDGPGEPQPLRARWEPVPSAGTAPRGATPVRVERRRRRSALGWFVHHYGWRAYALPVLAALTVVAVVQLTGPGGTGTPAAASPSVTAAAPAASVTVTVSSSAPTTVTVDKPGPTTTVQQPAPVTDASTPGLTAADPNGVFQDIASGALPPGAPFAVTGAGTFHVVPGTSPVFGTGSIHKTFTIEVEDGIEATSDDAMFAGAVVAILSDTRSWIGGGKFTLHRIDSGTPSFRISLTSQMTTREAQNCGWQIHLEGSCFNGALGRVFINDARWVRGAVAYNGDLGSYRVYAVNHEVGHALGYQHQACPETGGLAPVMMQQSWSVADDDLATLDPGGPVPADGKVCKYNPFAYPRGPDTVASSSGAG